MIINFTKNIIFPQIFFRTLCKCKSNNWDYTNGKFATNKLTASVVWTLFRAQFTIEIFCGLIFILNMIIPITQFQHHDHYHLRCTLLSVRDRRGLFDSPVSLQYGLLGFWNHPRLGWDNIFWIPLQLSFWLHSPILHHMILSLIF